MQGPNPADRADPPNRSASAGASEPIQEDSASPAAPVEKDLADVEDSPRSAALRAELTRLIDERIKISRELNEAKNKLSNLQALTEAGQDPPDLFLRIDDIVVVKSAAALGPGADLLLPSARPAPPPAAPGDNAGAESERRKPGM